jgi:phage terminase large subunit-like protein
MGLRGPGATARKIIEEEAPKRRRTDPWKKPGLSRADRVIAFCEDLQVTAGAHAGRKLKLRPWQKSWIRRIYRQDKFRRRVVRTAVKSIARKNGKTAEAAALGLCHLMGPEAEPRGEVYSAANDRGQAGKLFDEMVAMLQANPRLRLRVNIQRFLKKIEVLEGDGVGSIYMALSADAETKHGLSPSMVVYDELGQAKKRDLFDALDTAMGARANPLLLVISTQAADDNAPMSELIDYGLRVKAGEVTDDSFDLELWTAPADADPWVEATWRLANPALGDFRSMEDVRRMAQQAQEQRSKEPAFRNLILNQRIAAHVRFLSRAEWKACEAAYTLEDMAGSQCVGALDLSGVRDLTALVLVFLREGAFWSWPIFFMPEEAVRDRSEVDAMPYERWAKEGHITLIPGPTNDPEAIARHIAGLVVRLGLKLIAYDRWRIEDLVREMKKQGQDVLKASEIKGQPFEGLVLAEHGQGFKDMSVAVDALEQMVAQRTFRHPGNPVLTMCASNAVTERDPAGNRKFDKPKSTGRIDGIVSAAMAARMAINPPEQQGPSIYAARGALVM